MGYALEMDALQEIITRLERQREAIDTALAALREVGNSTTAQSPRKQAAGTKRGRKRRGPSPEGRKRIAEAQRARWAAKKAAEANGAKTRRKRGARKKTAATA